MLRYDIKTDTRGKTFKAKNKKKRINQKKEKKRLKKRKKRECNSIILFNSSKTI